MRFSSLIPLEGGGFSFEAGEVVLERAIVEVEGKPFYVSAARHGSGAPYTWGTLLPGTAPPPAAAVEIPSDGRAPFTQHDAEADTTAAVPEAPAASAENADAAEPTPAARKRRAKQQPVEDEATDADE